MKRIMILAALAAMTATAAMAQTVDAIAERAFELAKAKNYDAAFPLMKQAAERKDCISQATLGSMYYEGKGTEKNYSEAARWWSTANRNGCGELVKEYLDRLYIKVDSIRYFLKEDNTLMVVSGNYFDGTTKITIPEMINYRGKVYLVTQIGNNAFRHLSDLTSVAIPTSVTEIGVEAFNGCKHLTSVTIPNSVTTIDNWAFANCSSLKTVVIPKTVTSIGSYAFYNTPWDDKLPNGLVYVGDVFYKFKGEMPKGMTVTLRDGTKGIAGYAFGFSEMKSVVIPSTVTYIGDQAFEGCRGLTSITIPKSVMKIGARLFEGCYNLAAINVEIGNPKYDSRNNCDAIIETRTNTLVAGCKNTVIPNSVIYIGKGAFQNCDGLKSITIPNSVVRIGDGAFNSCDGLTSITIPNSVLVIESFAFFLCKNLASLTIPKSVYMIDEYAFKCENLNTIISNITDVKNVIVKKTAFNSVPSTCVLRVPRGTADAYRNTAPWNQFTNIVEE